MKRKPDIGYRLDRHYTGFQSPQSGSASAQAAQAKWTLMVYIAADNIWSRFRHQPDGNGGRWAAAKMSILWSK